MNDLTKLCTILMWFVAYLYYGDITGPVVEDCMLFLKVHGIGNIAPTFIS